MRRAMAIAIICLTAAVISMAQSDRTIVYGEHDGLSHRHVTQILQDKYGFIWLSTWNGLDRFDGREFVTFKSRPGDGVAMPSDRIRKIAIDDRNDNIINCRVDDSWFRFSLLTGKFTPVSTLDAKSISAHPGHGCGKAVKGDSLRRFIFTDRQGLIWTVLADGVSITSPNHVPVTIEKWSEKAEVKSIFADSIGRIWVATKDRTIRIFDHGSVGYLTAEGTISAIPSTFSSPIYCIYGDRASSDIWFGSKPDGLYRLQHHGGAFAVSRITPPKGFSMKDIYDITTDRYGRQWLATMDNGLVCIDHGSYSAIHFGRENKVRRIVLPDPTTLVAVTTEGLLTVDISPGRSHRWRLHRREPDRAGSLSNNACMDIASMAGKWYVATESGGVNMTADRITAPSLTFRHYDRETGLGSDVILSLTPFTSPSGPCLLAVTNKSLIIIDGRTGESREFADTFFGQQLSFSDARPVYIKAENKWIIGLNDGIAIIDGNIINADRRMFPIVLTSMTIENRPTEYMVNRLNEIHLTPTERTIDISFAVLDYRNAANIRYAYRVRGDADWHYLGNDNHIRLAELAPGEYLLDLKATNAMGTWNPAVRTLKIVVEPKFTETALFKVLLIIITATILLAVLLTVRFIRRMKRKQKETLEAYLSLLEESKKQQKSPISSTPSLSPEDEAIMNRVVAFVEEHLADSNIGVDDMASAAALSRSSLNRKLKTLVGLTPADFLREARIKRACTLLTESGTSVADTAYRCGFTDPKYFSRVFRQSVGVSPSDYKAGK